MGNKSNCSDFAIAYSSNVAAFNKSALVACCNLLKQEDAVKGMIMLLKEAWM